MNQCLGQVLQSISSSLIFNGYVCQMEVNYDEDSLELNNKLYQQRQVKRREEAWRTQHLIKMKGAIWKETKKGGSISICRKFIGTLYLQNQLFYFQQFLPHFTIYFTLSLLIDFFLPKIYFLHQLHTELRVTFVIDFNLVQVKMRVGKNRHVAQ